MAANTSYRFQAQTLQNLAVSPDPERYTVIEFDTQDAARKVIVKRVMQHVQHSSIRQVSIFAVGQKGAVETILDEVQS